MDNSFYVYALKDPRKDSAQLLYIGKGTGSRSHDHLARPDDSRKGKRILEIREIRAEGKELIAWLVCLSQTEIGPGAASPGRCPSFPEAVSRIDVDWALHRKIGMRLSGRLVLDTEERGYA